MSSSARSVAFKCCQTGRQIKTGRTEKSRAKVRIRVGVLTKKVFFSHKDTTEEVSGAVRCHCQSLSHKGVDSHLTMNICM